MKFNTQLLHGAGNQRYPHGATLPPITQVSAFQVDSAQEHEAIFARNREGFAYTRISNPTVDALEKRLCDLEGGAASVAFASGMAAISALFLNFLHSGDEVVAASTMYGGSVEFLGDLEDLGIHVRFVPRATVEEMEPQINEHTRAIYGEVIGNPSLEIMDVAALADMAHRHGLPLIVDSTTATPVLLRPLSLGADVVVHSTSKYINGSSNSLGGMVIVGDAFDWPLERYPALRRFGQEGKSAFLQRLRCDALENMGGCMAPLNAYLTILGMETLGLRMPRICENAAELARRLSQAPGIQVNYPLLDGHPYRELAQRQLGGWGGGILTFRAGSREKAYAILNGLKYVSIVSNIGDLRTLAVYPAATIFANGTPEQKLAAGIHDDTIRVSVGIEDVEDLAEDFLQAICNA